MLLVAAGSAAFSQTDTTGTRRPAYPDTSKDANAENPMPNSVVRRAVICSGVTNHEPIDSMTMVPSTVGKVFFFAEIAGMEGKTVTHRWMKDGNKVADIRISIASNRYRCHSSRSVAGKSGDWTVQLLDDHDVVLAERHFTMGTPGVQSPVGKT
jgi:hypothetical protein